MEVIERAVVVINGLVRDDATAIEAWQKHSANSGLYLIYMMPRMPVHLFQLPSMQHVEERAHWQSQKELTEWGRRLQVSPSQCLTVSGANAVLRVADDRHANIIFSSYPEWFTQWEWLEKWFPSVRCMRAKDFLEIQPFNAAEADHSVPLAFNA
jgi:hypothetical protein